MTPEAAQLARRLQSARRDARVRDPASRLRIRPGSLADYRELARFHYRAGRPAPGAHVWVARGAGGICAGVLVVSRPVLNGPWREAAWPGRFASGDRRADARRLNRELRVISRVVVDPRFRGMGVATRLIRAYLRRPLTIYTEALAAMGGASPMFVRAGMRQVDRAGQTRRDASLRRALSACRIEPHTLAAPQTLALRVRRAIAPALRAWARSSRATRSLAEAPLHVLMPRAAAGLCVIAKFVHERPQRSRRIVLARGAAADPDRTSRPLLIRKRSRP